MTTTCATGCTRPVRDTNRICDGCGDDIRQVLSSVATLTGDLAATLAKQRATGDHTHRGSDDHPLPIHVGAMRARSQLRVVLVGWCLDIAETHDHVLPVDTEAAMAAWLLERRDVIVAHPAAEDIHRELTDVMRWAERVVDRAPDLVLVGRCDAATCRQPLYAEPGATSVACHVCQVGYGVAERETAMRAELDDMLMTLAEAAWMISRFSPHRRYAVRNLLSTWAARRRITPAATDRNETAMYRYGDLAALVAHSHARRASA